MPWIIDLQTWLLLGAQFTFALTVFIFQLWLKSSFTNKVEGYKKDLEKALTEHQIKFSQLHADRAAVIKELYNKILMIERQMRSLIVKTLTNSFESIKDNAIEILNVLEYFSQLQNYVEEISIYLNEDLYNLINNFIEKDRKYFSEISNLANRLEESQKEDRQGEIMVFKTMLKDRLSATDLEVVRQKLIKEFRSLLGVN